MTIKKDTGMDTTAEVVQAASLAFEDEALNEELTRDMMLCKDRLMYDLKKLPATTSYQGKMYAKTLNIKKTYEEFVERLSSLSRDEKKRELRYLDILTLNVMQDTEHICDTSNPSFDLSSLKGLSLMDETESTLSKYLELFPLYLDDVLSSFEKDAQEIYKQITDLAYLTDYGTNIYR